MLVIQLGASRWCCRSSELSERNLTLAQVELGVHVPHEHVAHDPEVRTDILAHDPAHALRRAGGDLAEAECVRGDGEVLAAKSEADAGRAVAWVGVVAVARAGAARYRLVELGGVGGGGDDERRAAVDDGGGRAKSLGGADGDRVHVDLPVPLLGDWDGGESTGVEGVARAADGQLGARVGELEGEDRLGGHAGLDESLDDRGCVVLGDGLEAHAHQTYSDASQITPPRFTPVFPYNSVPVVLSPLPVVHRARLDAHVI
jgi:hypothetical protein